MKICVTGPILGFSGFSVAVRNFTKALFFASQSKDVSLVVRNLKYDQADPGSEYNPDDWLKSLLTQDLNNVDILIQSTTCNVEAVVKPGICNGLYTFLELDRIPNYWVDKANQFDFIIVPCRFNAQTLVRCGVKKPILVMPVPSDMDKYQNVSPYELPNAVGRTVFYNICQLSAKKGIDSLLRAYFAAFADRPDEVLLVLKTYINMANRQNEKETIKNFINQVKTGCQIPLPKLPPVLPLINIMNEDQIYGLHQRCDAYVNSSKGEGWCLPAFDALAFGKTLITNNYGGMGDYVSDDNALIYSGTISHVYNSPHPEPYLYIGVARWFEPSTAHMADIMLSYHLLKQGNEKGILDEKNKEQWDKIIAQQKQGIALGEKFDYRRTGGLILNQIIAAVTSFKQNGSVTFDKQVRIES